MGIIILILISATIVEKLYGTPFAMRWFYTAPWTLVLWGISAVGCLSTFNPRRPAWLLHVSFVIILAAALVTHLWSDTVGNIMSYIGYALLLISIVAFFFRKDSRWRTYLRHLTLILLILSPLALHAQPTPHTVQRAVGQAWGQLYVWHNGRVCPMHTLDVELCQKLYGTNGYGSCTADQVVLGHMLYPDQWEHVPLKHRRTSAERAEQQYLLRQIYDAKIFGIPMPLLELVAQYISEGHNIDAYHTLQKIHTIQYKQMAPADRITDRKFNTELWFVDFDYTHPFAIALAVIGVITFLMVALRITGKTGRYLDTRIKDPSLFLLTIQSASFLFLTAMLSIRWYITGHIPMVSGHETMQTMAWFALLIGIILCRKPLLSSGLLLVAAMAMMVSMMSISNPQLTALVPALQSPLLSLHVSIIMLSYCLFALLMLINLVALFRRETQFYYLSQVILYPALFLLTIGIFIGALWAGQSWGRLWGWDPKEVWALITMLLYALPIHLNLRRRTLYHAYMVAAFLSVVMTYFGVNYILGGLHAYS